MSAEPVSELGGGHESGLKDVVHWAVVTVGPTTAQRPRRGLVAAILIGVLAVAFEAYGTLTAMPAAAGQFGRLDLYDWAFTIFTVSQVFGIVIAGRACDRIGFIVPLAAGLGFFAAGLVGAGAAINMHMLLVMRAVQGLGGGALNVALMVLVGRAFDDEERPRLMAVFSFCWVLPSFIGPPLAAFITGHFGWHWVFWGLLPVLLVGLLVGARPLGALWRVERTEIATGLAAGSPRRGTSRPVPIWAAGAAALGAALIQYAGHRLDLIAIPVAAAGVAALGLALPAIMPAGFLRARPGLASVALSRGLATGAFMTSESYLLLALTQEHGLSLRSVSFLLCVGSVGWTIGSWVQARPWLRLRRDQIIVLGATAILLGVAVMFGCALWRQLPIALMITSYGVAGFGMGLLVSSTSLAIMTLSRPAQLGRWTSSLQVSEGLGNSLVLGIAGSVYAALRLRHGWGVVFGGVYLVPAIAALLCLLVSTRIGPVHDKGGR